MRDRDPATAEDRWREVAAVATVIEMRDGGVHGFANRQEMEQQAGEGIEFIVTVLRELEAENGGLGYRFWVLAGAAAAVGTAPWWLPAIGFTSAGVAAGSYAAGVMSWAATTGFGAAAVSACQSVAAVGLASPYIAPFAAGAAGVGSALGAGGKAVLAGAQRVVQAVRGDARQQERVATAEQLWQHAVKVSFPQ